MTRTRREGVSTLRGRKHYRVTWDGHTLADPERLMELEQVAKEAGGNVRLCLYEPSWEGGYFTFWATFLSPVAAEKIGAELRLRLVERG